MVSKNLAPYALELIAESASSITFPSHIRTQNNLCEFKIVSTSEKNNHNYSPPPESINNDSLISSQLSKQELREPYCNYYLKVYIENSNQIIFLDLEITERSSYSNVFVIYNQKIKKVNVLKISLIQSRSLQEEKIIEVLNQKNFPFLVNVYDIYKTKQNVLIFMEYGDFTLNNFYESLNLTYDTCEISLLIIKEIIIILKFLKDENMIYSDLKEENIIFVKTIETPEKVYYRLKFCDLESLINYDEYKESGWILKSKSYFPFYYNDNFLDENQFYHINVFSIMKIIKNIVRISKKNSMKILEEFIISFDSDPKSKFLTIETFDKFFHDFLTNHGIDLGDKKINLLKVVSEKIESSFKCFKQNKNNESSENNERTPSAKANLAKHFFNLTEKLFQGFKERNEAFQEAKQYEDSVFEALEYEIKSKNKEIFYPLLQIIWIYFETEHYSDFENCFQKIKYKIQKENLHPVDSLNTDDDDSKFINEFFYRYYNFNALYFLYIKKNRELEIAIDFFKKSLTICEKLHDSKSTNIAQLYNNYGEALYKIKTYKNAFIKFNQSNEIRKDMTGKKNYKWMNIPKHNMAKTYFKLGEIKKAIDLMNTLINLIPTNEKEDSYYYIIYQFTLMKFYFFDQNFVRVKEIFNEISRTLKKISAEIPDSLKQRFSKWEQKTINL